MFRSERSLRLWHPMRHQ